MKWWVETTTYVFASKSKASRIRADEGERTSSASGNHFRSGVRAAEADHEDAEVDR